MSRPAIPDGFERLALGEVCRPRQWPTISQEALTANGYPVYGANGLIGYYPRYTHAKPTIAITCRGSTCGEVHLTREKSYITGNAMALDELDVSRIDERYAAYALRAHGLKDCITGSAQPQIIGSALRQVEILAPPLVEQTKIAQILDTLDTQIRRTEALIAKLERIKQGLLTDLLTRGIDRNGQLRPTPDQAPHLYKDSPLGWIPMEWTVSDLTSLLADKKPAMRSGPFGSALLKEELVESGVPLLGIDNVHVEAFRAEYTRFVTLQKFRELSRYAVRPNDIMITIMGTVGRCCLVPEGIGPALSSKHTWTLTLDDERYVPFLAMLQLNYAPWVTRQIARDEQGGIMSAIRSETLRSLMLPVPSIAEQTMISERLRYLNARIESERELTSGLKSARAGLMDDLLTGRVRVTPLLDTIEQLHG